DNDAGGAYRFGSSAYNVSETATQVSVQVTRSNGSAGNGRVRVVSTGGTAVPGTHYVSVNEAVSLRADQSSQSVLVTLLPAVHNPTVDAPRTIQLPLQEPLPVGLSSIGSPAMTLITIGDNDVGGTIQWAVANVRVSETAGTVTLNATRTGGAADQVGVTWTITDVTTQHGVDFAGDTTGTLSFAANGSVPIQPLVIPLLNPAGPHGNRTFKVTLS